MPVSSELIDRLANYGALPEQLVDLTKDASPKSLRYRDLVRATAPGRPVVAVESQGQPRAYVFDARTGSELEIGPWVRRVAFRGDADFIAVLRSQPGRLDVYPVVLGKKALPEPIEHLPEGRLRLPSLLQSQQPGEVQGVRKALRELLRRSISDAKRLGKEAQVDAHDAISLVGRALFWRFLIDRELLAGLEPAALCGDKRAHSFAECLATKPRALRTFQWLDDTFNGGLLEFRSRTRAAEVPDAVYERVVGNIAYAASAEGQLQLELPKEWREVNFAHVPVGLLSEVYEAFAHDEDEENARHDSIYYTPRHIAEFMVDESLASLDDVERPRVLDPAAGAGVFLVAAFRALVAREWTLRQQPPTRRALRRILHSQLTGFEINDPALRLAELALYLTAIELDPQRRPKPLSLLRFEKPLRDATLHLRGGDFTRGSLEPVESRFRAKFDLVIGNPPWTAKATLSDKERWADITRDLVRLRLGQERAKTFSFPDTYPDIPFIYRSMEWTRPGGQIALVTHARWLFPGDARDQARQDLLESVRVTGILNCAAVRETSIWPNSRAPFAILFATNEKPEPSSAFQFVSPLLDDPRQKRQARLRIDWNDAQVMSVNDVLRRPWSLKSRFRGTSFDQPLVARLVDSFPSVASYLESLGTRFCRGYQLAKKEHESRLRGLPNLVSEQQPAARVPERRPSGFCINVALLKAFQHERVDREPSRSACMAPLLLVKKSPPADPALPRVAVSTKDLAFSQSWFAASFFSVADGIVHARWLQLLVQSNLFLYFALLCDGWFGVERDHYVVETLQAFPVVPLKNLEKRQSLRFMTLSEDLWNEGWSQDLQGEIDHIACDAYGLDDIERDTLRDTVATSLPYARNREHALRAPENDEVRLFAATLEGELAHVLGASGRAARVRVRADVSDAPWGILQIDWLPQRERKVKDAPLPWEEILIEAERSGATLIIVRVTANTWMAVILKQYRYWTRTRARMLALSLLSKDEP